MAIGDPSSPARFLYGQSASDARNLTIPIFSGLVLAAYDAATKFRGTVREQSVAPGAAEAIFFKTWKIEGQYHQPGVELLGDDIDTTEIRVSIDDPFVAHFAVSDLDRMLSAFDPMSQFAEACGNALAKEGDRNILRQNILSARRSNDGPFPGGNVVSRANLVTSGAIDGGAYLDAIREACLLLEEKDVPEDMEKYAAFNPRVFDAIKFARDAAGQFVFGDMIRSSSSGVIPFNGVNIMKTTLLPNADESADTSVYSKYRADYSKTSGVLWSPDATAIAVAMGTTFETTRDVRRQEDFTVAKMLMGLGPLRPEVACEFRVP